jgi:tetratricopeptide (TPR) repeat protein
MLFRPLFLVSIVLVAVSAAAQLTPVDNNVRASDFQQVISGTVRDLDNRPVSGVHVELQDCLTSRLVASAYTFANGSFELREIPRGQYEVVVTSGISEARTRVELPGNNDVTLRIASNASVADKSSGSKSSVSLSQMKVPGKAQKLFQKAMDAFRLSHLDDAFSFVQKALGLYPDYARALTLRGVMNLQRGDTQSAEPDLQKAVELDYSDDMGFVALASLYNTEGKFDKALQILDRGMTVHPNSWQALSEMARGQIGKHNYEDALKSIAKAENYVPPTVNYLHLFRAQALAGLGNIPGAVTELNTYLAKEPTGQNAEVAHKMLGKLGASETTEAKQ